MIPLFDLELAQEDLDAIAETLRSGWLTMGPRTEAFEAAFAEHLGCRHAVAVASCTAALHLAYLAAGVGPGDEVVVPAFTFAATAAAVVHCGARPVFADILGPHDLSLDPDRVAAAITPRTKAVTTVHFAGYPAPMDDLLALCDERGVALVEDAAHAPMTRVGDRMAGTVGSIGCFSFFSNKILSAGEGGLLATDDDDVARLARARRPVGHRIDEPRAALLLSRLRRLGDDVARRRALSRRYRELLHDVEGVTLPFTDDQVDVSSCYVMPVLVEPEIRDEVRAALRDAHGVQTSILYPPLHLLTAYATRFGEPSLPHTEHASAAEITIPLFAHLTHEQQDQVVDGLLAEVGSRVA